MSPLLGSRTAVKCVLIKRNVRLASLCLLLGGEISEFALDVCGHTGEAVVTKDPTTISLQEQICYTFK